MHACLVAALVACSDDGQADDEAETADAETSSDDASETATSAKVG